jgi:hypothetical protein
MDRAMAYMTVITHEDPAVGDCGGQRGRLLFCSAKKEEAAHRERPLEASRGPPFSNGRFKVYRNLRDS